MTEIQNLANKIKNRYGTIKRARGSFLYTEKRIRLTDLFLEGGRAILGWGSDYCSAWTICKNVLSRGLTGSFITDFNAVSKESGMSRLSRSVSSLLAGERFAVIYNSKDEALKDALFLSSSGTSVYRPWNPEKTDWRSVDCVLIAPPLAWAENLWILAVKQEVVQKNPEIQFKSVFIPAAVEAAITRSVYDLIKALQAREEKDWFIFDKVVTKYWTRKGPWLFPKMSEEKYSDFVEHCLDCELVISPVYNVPSVVPFGADSGVFKKLLQSPFEF